MPLRVFIVTGTPYARRGGDRGLEDLAEQGALPRQRGTAALAGHLRHRAAEVEVDVGHAVLRAQDLGRLADVRRVGAVELHRAHRLLLVEDQHLAGRRVTLDQAAAGDHLADVEAGALLAAQPPVGGVGDAGHRGEHDGGRRPRATRAAGLRPAAEVGQVERRSGLALLLLGRLLRGLLRAAFFVTAARRLDGALPGDRLERLERAVAHLGRACHRGHQVDQAARCTHLSAVNAAGSGFEGHLANGVVEARGLDQRVARRPRRREGRRPG